MQIFDQPDHPYKALLDKGTDGEKLFEVKNQSVETLQPESSPVIHETKLQLLGKPQLQSGDKLINLRSHRGFALLGLLSLEVTPTSRKRVAQLLWPEEEQPTNDRLRVLLSKLKQLAPDLIISDANTIALNPDIQHNADALKFLRLHDDNQIQSYREALDLYTGDFLEGISFEASVFFETWLEHQRSIWREVLDFMYHEVVEFLLKEGKRSSDLQDALHLAHKHLSIFPWSDAMVLKLCLIYIKKRQPNRALEALERYNTRISKEFGMQLPESLVNIKSGLVGANVDKIIHDYKDYFNN